MKARALTDKIQLQFETFVDNVMFLCRAPNVMPVLHVTNLIGGLAKLRKAPQHLAHRLMRCVMHMSC